MRKGFRAHQWLILAMLGPWPAAAMAVSVPIVDSKSVKFGDTRTFNWRVLEQTAGIPVPATPTGNQTGFLRLFSNGNKHNPMGTEAVVWNPDGPADPFPDTFNVDTATGFGSSQEYYGLQWGQQSNQLEQVTTVGTIVTFLENIQGLSPTDAVSPIFGSDQNQNVNVDIFIKCKLHLIDPSLILTGQTPTDIDAAIAAAAASKIRTFHLFDDNTAPPVPLLPDDMEDTRLTDDAALASDDDQWVPFPGMFDADKLSNQAGGDGPLLAVDNNMSGNNADWGWYFLDASSSNQNSFGQGIMDLRTVMAADGVTAVASDWLFVVQFQGILDNNGKEEVYLLGALDVRPTIAVAMPEPTSFALIGLGVLIWCCRRQQRIRG